MATGIFSAARVQCLRDSGRTKPTGADVLAHPNLPQPTVFAEILQLATAISSLLGISSGYRMSFSCSAILGGEHREFTKQP